MQGSDIVVLVLARLLEAHPHVCLSTVHNPQPFPLVGGGSLPCNINSSRALGKDVATLHRGVRLAGPATPSIVARVKVIRVIWIFGDPR